MTDLPQGWEENSIRELFDFKYGKGLTQEKRRLGGGFAVYGSNGIVGEHDQAITQGPTIIVGRKGSVGEVHLSPTKCWPIDTTYFIDEFPDGSPPKFWAFYLKSLRLGQQERSSAIPGISREDIYKLKVPVPPLAEQRRIVAKLEELLGKVEACQKRLAKIPVIFKRFRQSVLAAACSGDLTSDWRRNSRNADDTPDTWQSIEFGRLIAEGPQNGIYKPQALYGRGTLIVRIDNFYDGAIAPWTTLKRVELSSKEVDQFNLANEDILINRVNSIKFLGKSAIVKNLKEPCVFESNMMRCRLNHEIVLPDYAILYLRSATGRQELRANAKHAVNQSSINQDDVKSSLFSLPPLDEQGEIINCVEALFQVADEIEARYRKARPQVDKLTQSILAKAFRGELVPTEAELARRVATEGSSV